MTGPGHRTDMPLMERNMMTSRHAQLVLAAAALLGIAACSGNGTTDENHNDAGVADASIHQDAGGPPDAGPLADAAQEVDAGPQPRPMCGNHVIEPGERVSTCPEDVNYLSTWSTPTPLGSGTTYYISPSGDDDALGTQQQPWRTIAKANATLQPGDTVLIASGTYDEAIDPTHSGSSEATRITFRAAPGADVILTRHMNLDARAYVTVSGVNMLAYHFAMLADADHVIIEHGEFLPIDDTSSSHQPGFQLRGTTYSVLRNSRVVGWQRSYQDTVEFTQGAHHNLIENNQFEVGGSHTIILMDGDGTFLSADSPHHNIVRNNYLSNEYHSCVNEQIGAHHNVFEGNFLQRCGTGDAENIPKLTGEDGSSGAAFYMLQPYGIYRYNTVLHSGDRGFYSNPVMAWGGTAGGNPIVDGFVSVIGNAVYNNTLYHNYNIVISLGIYYRPAGNTMGEYGDNVFMNNILWENGIDPHTDGDTVIRYVRYWDAGNPAPPAPSGDLWANNVIENASEQVFEYTHDTYTMDEAAAALPQLLFSDNIGVDPALMDPAAQDFGLQATSPAIDAGAFLTTTSGAGSGTSVPVLDARFFIDGWGIVDGDTIQIGGATARVTAVDYATNTLTVDQSLSWSNGDGVSLPYFGARPDIGAAERVP